jgi:hypothetical protein
MSKSIRRFLSLLLILQLVIPYSVFAAPVGEFTSIFGKVTQTRATEVVMPVVKSPVQLKDIIITDQASSATMVFSDESTIVLSGKAKLEIKEFLFKDKSRTGIFSLAMGKLNAKVSKYIGGDNIFEVQSPTAIVGVRGTGFEFIEAVNQENKNMATVSCTEGSLNLSALSSTGTVVSAVVLEAGQMAVIIGGVITISAITAAAGGGASAATASGSGATAATAGATVAAATAGVSTTTIVGVAAGVAAVGAAGTVAADSGGGSSSSTPTSTTTSTPSSTSTSATYDATGTWNWVDTYRYNNCGDSNIYETGTMTINQTGGTWTATTSTGGSMSGTVSGATYTMTPNSFPEDGGTATETATITLSSSTTGTYSGTYSWTDGTSSCSGGYNGTMTKVQ